MTEYNLHGAEVKVLKCIILGIFLISLLLHFGIHGMLLQYSSVASCSF